MSMIEWAKHEVEIACQHEAPDRKDGEWDYGCACYESALKAFLSLMDDDHSGFSFGTTAFILKRLLEEKPLSPIEDVPEVWKELTLFHDNYKTYQCIRMSSLFKNVDVDGNVSYRDVGRCFCRDSETGNTFSCGLESRILDELHPIMMPYYPPLGLYEFTVRELLTDSSNGDFDTKAILTLKTPDGSVEQINRYFAEGETGWIEIDLIEYKRREEADRRRRKASEGKDG